MGLISTFRRLFGRDNTPGPGDDFWYNPIGTNYSGVKVTPESAMGCTAVLGCVRVIAETFAGLPFGLYRRKGDSRKRDYTNPIHKLISTQPCGWMTSFEWREMQTAFVLLRGNAYAQKVYSRRGELVSLNPLNPVMMKPKLNTETARVEYVYKTQANQQVVFDQDEILHIKGYTTDSVTGISVIAMAGTAIGLSLAAEQYGAKVFTNGAMPGGILTHPAKLTDEAHKRIKQSWQDAHSGLENSHKVGIIEEGMSWTKVGMSSEDVQFIDSRKFQVEEIARMFRVPPHMIQDLSRATFSNIEHQALSFVQYTMLPWLRRWEGAINTRLIPEKEQEKLYCEFLVDGLLRGDIQARYTAYQVARQNGWLSSNDIRKLENMEPLEGEQGDLYIVQANMVDLEKLANGEIEEENPDKNAPKDDETDPENDKKEPESDENSDKTEQKQRKLGTFAELFRSIMNKNAIKEEKRVTSLLNKGASADEFVSFYKEHGLFLRETLIPQCNAFIAAISDSERDASEEVNEIIDIYEKAGVSTAQKSVEARAENKLKEVLPSLIERNVSGLVKELMCIITEGNYEA